jgi:hypothetical protein
MEAQKWKTGGEGQQQGRIREFWVLAPMFVIQAFAIIHWRRRGGFANSAGTAE